MNDQTPDSSTATTGLSCLSDHDLLVAMVADQRAMNLAEAARLVKLAEFHRRRAPPTSRLGGRRSRTTR